MQVPQFAAGVSIGRLVKTREVTGLVDGRRPLCGGRAVSRLDATLRYTTIDRLIRLAHVYAHHALGRSPLSADH